MTEFKCPKCGLKFSPTDSVMIQSHEIYHYNYLEIPVLLDYPIIRVCKNNLSILIGPQFSYLIDAYIKDDPEMIILEDHKFYIKDKTEPVDYNDQDWFVNFMVKIETTLDSFQLLYFLKAMEKNAGRYSDQIRYGPRILDLDIIFYDRIVINSSELIIPHPKMHKRRFVLKSICDINPKFVHPVLKMNMKFLLSMLKDRNQRVVKYCFDY